MADLADLVLNPDVFSAMCSLALVIGVLVLGLVLVGGAR